MSQIKLTTESVADLPECLIKEYDIKFAYLYINTQSGSYKDVLEVKSTDIFEYYKKSNVLPKTSTCTVSDYTNLFKPIIESGNKVIHISISSNFSSCYQNACIAAAQFPEGSICVIDSKNLSTGIALCIVRAHDMIQKNEPIENIKRSLINDVVPSVEASFILDSLTFLRASGRCSSLLSLGANILKIRPSIEVKNGKMQVGKKYRGLFFKCVEQYVDDKLQNRNDIDKSLVFLTHAMCSSEIVSNIKNKLKEQYNFERIIESYASCTISSHCGPNTIGVLFFRKNELP